MYLKLLLYSTVTDSILCTNGPTTAGMQTDALTIAPDTITNSATDASVPTNNPSNIRSI